MTTRIGTYGSNQAYIAQLFEIQSRTQKEQLQVTTGLKSQTFSGIAIDSTSFLNLTNQVSLAQQFVNNNDIASTKLSAASTSIDSAKTTITNFKNRLNAFSQNNTKDPQAIKDLQEYAFQCMNDLQSFLSANVGGDYIFSGGRVTTQPVQLPATTLADFQGLYDGANVTYATTRQGDLADFNIGGVQTGKVTYDPATGKISAANAGAFSAIPVGARVNLDGVVPPRPMTVVANNGTDITVSRLTTSPEPTASISWASLNTGAVGITGETQAMVAGPGAPVTSTTGGTAGTGYGTLTISSNGTPDQIIVTASTLDAFNGAYKQGDTITLSGGTYAANDGGYKVTNNDGTTLILTRTDTANLNSNDTGSLQFTAGADTIKANVPGSLAGLRVGMVFTVSGTDSNNGTYEVLSNDGTTVGLKTTKLDFFASGDSVPVTGENLATLTPSTGPAVTSAGYQSLIIGQTNGSGQFTLKSTAAGTPFPLADFAPNSTITVTGSKTPGNDGLYTVVSNNGGTDLTLVRAKTSVITDATGATVNESAANPLTYGADASGQLTITAANSTTFTGQFAPGDTITINDSSVFANNGAYKVVANNGGTLTLTRAVAPATVTPESATGASFSYAIGATTPVILPAATGTVNFNGSTMTAGTANAFSALKPGQVFTVSGTQYNNGTYQVKSVTNDPVYGANTVVTVEQITENTNVAAPAESAAVLDDGTNTLVSPADYTSLNMSAPDSQGRVTVSSTPAGAFAGFSAIGSRIVIGSAATPENNGTYRVVGIDPTNSTLTLEKINATAPTTFNTANASFSAESWYKGDNLTLAQPIDQDRNLDVGIYASDPAFEKAMRAMAIIAQGLQGTAGGLDNHQDRIASAQYLLQSALDVVGAGTPPYGQEQTSNLTSLGARIGFASATIKTKTDNQNLIVNFLQTRIGNISQVDKTTAIANLLTDNNTLQAAYQSMSQIWNLSLLNYLK